MHPCSSAAQPVWANSEYHSSSERNIMRILMRDPVSHSSLTHTSTARLMQLRASRIPLSEAPVKLRKSSDRTGSAATSTSRARELQQNSATKGTERTKANRKSSGSRFYPFITGFPFPLGPLFSRETVRRQVDKDVWVFEQTQALESFSVYTPVRMTIIRLKSGGLWVHAPVAPTEECISLVNELGPVEFIVLPTFAYEHKVFVGPFSRRFPTAKVYVAPFQWSFPLNLPPQFFGIFPSGELISGDRSIPWADEIEQEVLSPPSIGNLGSFVRTCECAFFHKASRTLLVTDALMYASDAVPDVVPKDAALELARDGWLVRFVSGGRSAEEVKELARPEPVEDTEENRIRGWRRMSLLILFFNPSDLLTPDRSFEAFKDRLIVPPVVETLVYSKIKVTVRNWVERMLKWPVKQVIPAHFDAPIPASPALIKQAFSFCYEDDVDESLEVTSGQGWNFSRWLNIGSKAKPTRPATFLEADMRTLTFLNTSLISSGAIKANAEEL